MKKIFLFQNPKFIRTAITPEHYPLLKNDSGRFLPEIAVVGRSNVGKSSLLNHLFQSKKLVKTSSTPGKTQALNFFTVNQELSFSDLPGYGYAKVPQDIRKQWGKMIQTYLEKRETLQLILFLFDIRRNPTQEDLQFLEWVLFHQKALILVFTKVDKVTQAECMENTKKILQRFNLENLHYVHYSVPKNTGRKQLIAMINDALEDELSNGI